jgi:ABC-type multidrug transport system ATPase subunit
MICIYDEVKMKDIFLGYYGFDDGSIGASLTWVFVWFALLAFIAVVLISPLTSKISRSPVASNMMRLRSSDYSAPNDASMYNRKSFMTMGDNESEASRLTKSSFDSGMKITDIVNHTVRMSVDITTLQMELRQRNTFAATISPEYQMTLSFRNVCYMNNDYYHPHTNAHDDRTGRAANNSVSNNTSENPGKATRGSAKSDGSGIDSTSHGPPRDVILYDITGKVSPRNLCAIVDGSNEGTERILLRVLSGRADYTGKVSGDIAINGHIIPQGVRVSGVGFVAARDAITHGCLTVREALTFAALLRRTDQTSCPALLAWKRRLDNRNGNAVAFSVRDRLPGKSGDLADRVQEVIDLMGLGEVAEKIIGEYSMVAVGATTPGGIGVEHGPMHQGLTPYQMRCVTIGIELVNKPPLVFLENPFFGLDRYSSKLVSETLRSLAAGGRTVICSLSSPPPSHMLESFDELLLLGRGMLIYAGSTNKLLSYFDNLGFERRGRQSAVDFILDIVSEQATLRAFGDRKSAMLSLEDLSDLRRTMITDNEALGIIDDGNATANPTATATDARNTNEGLGVSKRHSATTLEEAENSITRHGLIPASNVALGPAARVLAKRRWVTAYRTVSSHYY